MHIGLDDPAVGKLPCFPKSCHGCGTCAGVCPTGAITMTLQGAAGLYTPVVSPKNCSGCGLCLSVCPTIDANTKPINKKLPLGGVNQCELDLQIFGRARSDSPADVLLGIHRQLCIGYTVDAGFRWQASSGGLVSALLIYALENDFIDGALVTGIDRETGLPKSYIARSPETIVKAMGSKYCVAPVNESLRTILQEQGRYAVVGLPCQLHGLRLAQRQSRKLYERIVYIFTLFCSGTMGAQGTTLLRKSLGLEVATDVRYRGSGWPGGFQAAQNSQHYIPYPSYVSLLRTYTPPYCFLCWDATGEFADLSFGDAWLPEVMREDKQGTSMVIARSDKGQALLAGATTCQQIVLHEISDADFLRARGAWKSKKQYRGLKLIMSRLWYPSSPAITVQNYPNDSLLQVLRILFWYARYFLATNILTRTVVARVVVFIARRLVKPVATRSVLPQMK